MDLRRDREAGYIAYALLHRAGETHGMAFFVIAFVGHPRHLRGQKG
jgi:hypothetical protein